MRRRLGKRFTADAVEAALRRLEELGYIDDARFAREWVSTRTRLSARSARRLFEELREKGVDRRLAEAAIENLDDECTALDAAEKFVTRLANADREQFLRKLFGHLSRRGYSRPIAQRTAMALWQRRQDEDASDNL